MHSAYFAFIVTYSRRSTPRLENQHRSNPELEIHVAHDEKVGHQADLWRSCDRFLRDCWKQNRGTVSGTHLWMLEHDVWVTCPLPDCSGIGGMGGQHIKRAENRDWVWLQHANRLPQGMVPYGMAPLGVTVYHRAALDALISPEWDSLFEADVFCELRLPSVIAHGGYPPEELPLPHVRAGAITPNWCVPGIYHAMKGTSLQGPFCPRFAPAKQDALRDPEEPPQRPGLSERSVRMTSRCEARPPVHRHFIHRTRRKRVPPIRHRRTGKILTILP